MDDCIEVITIYDSTTDTDTSDECEPLPEDAHNVVLLTPTLICDAVDQAFEEAYHSGIDINSFSQLIAEKLVSVSVCCLCCCWCHLDLISYTVSDMLDVVKAGVREGVTFCTKVFSLNRYIIRKVEVGGSTDHENVVCNCSSF